MPVSIIPAALGMGSSIVGSLLGGGSKTSTSSTAATLSPELKALQDRLLAYSNDSMLDPAKGIAPIRTAGLDSINRSYMGIPQRLASQFASRGYGSSGEFGNSL